MPWLAAVVGLVLPLVGSGFAVWPLTLIWLVILVVIRVVGPRAEPEGRSLRIAIALGLVPVLILLGWEGGWWLIPADIAWLVVELVDRPAAGPPPPAAARRPARRPRARPGERQ